MHYINYLLVGLLIFIIYKVITEKRVKAARAQRIEPCRDCGAPGQLEEDYFDYHVRCTSKFCAMAGPKGSSEEAAISNWNNLASMSTVVAWQFQAAGLALENQRLKTILQGILDNDGGEKGYNAFELINFRKQARNALEARHG